MEKQLCKRSVDLETIDVTAILSYANKIQEIGQGFNKMTAPIYIRDFSVAYDLTSNALFKATRLDLEAEKELKMAESIAYLENAKAYLDSKGIKDTADARKHYILLDPGVQHAMDRKAQTTALVYLLKTKLQGFKSAMENVKKIAYGDLYLSPDEGI